MFFFVAFLNFRLLIFCLFVGFWVFLMPGAQVLKELGYIWCVFDIMRKGFKRFWLFSMAGARVLSDFGCF